MHQADKTTLLAEEELIVRHSGEIPEIAFHGSLYYLTKDPEGPRLRLTTHDLAPLKAQAVARYKEIILRDLAPENRDKRIYRGLRRTIFNWKRLGEFCRRQQLEVDDRFRGEVAAGLLNFLRQEAGEVRKGLRESCINCSAEELSRFAEQIGIASEQLPPAWRQLCRKKS